MTSCASAESVMSTRSLYCSCRAGECSQLASSLPAVQVRAPMWLLEGLRIRALLGVPLLPAGGMLRGLFVGTRVCNAPFPPFSMKYGPS